MDDREIPSFLSLSYTLNMPTAGVVRTSCILAFFILLGACSSPDATPVPTPTPTGAQEIVQEAAVAMKPPPLPPPPPCQSPSKVNTSSRPKPNTAFEVEVAFPNLGFDRMVFLTHAGDGGNRLFLLLQPGCIMAFPNDERVSSVEVFLNIQDRVNDDGNEEGLLGLAFAPDFAANGHFYVYYTAVPRRAFVSRFSVLDGDPTRADPASEEVILEVRQRFKNHNGGTIAFGPDGLLYIGLGDGGSRGDPLLNGQNPATLLGSILRIDPTTPQGELNYSIPSDNPFFRARGFRQEIWAYGFRNPWRFSFDTDTGDLWAGDVGQAGWEEIDLVRWGGNYGWNVMEGAHCFRPPTSCNRVGLQPPVAEYRNTGEDCSVTGGYVYRGSRLPSLKGAYIYGDFCSGKIWALRYDGRKLIENVLLVDSSLQISSFGQDRNGELYILSFDGGIYRLRQTDQAQ